MHFVEPLEARQLLSVTMVSEANSIPFERVVIDANPGAVPLEKCLADVEGNGKLDAIVGHDTGNGGHGGIVWYEFPESGVVTDHWNEYTIASPGGSAYEDIQPYDMEGNGITDLVASYNNQVVWFENPRNYGGDPKAGPWPMIVIGPDQGHEIVLGDFDGDGKIDVATRLHIYFQNSPTNWTTVSTSVWPEHNTLGLSLFNSGSGLGNVDLAGPGPGSSTQLGWYENPRDHGGNARTDLWVFHPIGNNYAYDYAAGGEFGTAMQAYDVNGDGMQDIITADGENGNGPVPAGGLIWWQAPANRITGTWIPHEIDPTVQWVHKINIADMTNVPGQLDIVFSEQSQSVQKRVAIVSPTNGDTTGTNWDEEVLSTLSGHNQVVGDVLGNGNLDVLNAPHGVGTGYEPVELFVNLLPTKSSSPPATPTGVAATGLDGQVTISWAGVSGSNTYDLFRSTSPGGEGSTAYVMGISTTSYRDNGVSDGTTYYYTVEAVNSALPSKASSEVSAEPTTAPLVQYEFDQSSGVDSSGRGNNGTLVGSPSFAAGESGEAISLNGSTQYVSLADNPSIDPTSAITLSAWIDAADWNGNRRIIQKGNQDDQYRLLAESGVLKFDLYGVGTVTAPLPSTGTWHLITGTYDGSTMKLYVDGMVVGSTSASGSLDVTGDPLTVGTKNGSTSGGDFFHGLMDGVRVYGRALTATEVAALISKAPSNETSIVVTPASPNVADGATQQFTAIALDQYGQPMATQPTFTWSLTNNNPAGSISSNGLYSAPTTGTGSDTLRASDTSAGISSNTATANYAAVSLSPVLEYEFDSSSAADSSGDGNNGTLLGNPTFVTGHPGEAISLNGSNQYVTVANNSTLDPTSAITLSAWIDAADWNGNRRIIEKGSTDDQYRLTAENGVLKFDLFGVGVITAALPSTGTWHLVTGTYDGATMKLYVDGVVVASAAHTGAIAVTSDPVMVGTKNVTETVAGNFFHGLLDDVRIYPRAISAAEVQGLMQSVPQKETSIVVTPASPNVSDGATQQFTAVALDQYGQPMATQPTFTWSLTNSAPAGAISSTGLYTAPATGAGSDTVQAADLSAAISSNTATANYAAVSLSPVLQYEFDSSSAADSSGDSNNGTLVGNPTFATGHPGEAISLNGSNQYIAVANSATLNPSSAITLSAWIDAADWNGNRRIIQKGNTDDQYRLTAEGGVLKFDLHGVGIITAALPSTGTWHLITGTYDGSTMILYVDGVVVASAAHSGSIAVTSDPLNIGNKNSSTTAGDTFHGLLDDVRIYPRAISASEVQALLQSVPQKETSIAVTPASPSVADGAAQQFTAIALDQYGQPMATQPTFTWSLTNSSPAGSISSAGLYSAPSTGAGSDTVQASDTSAGISSNTATANYSSVNLSPAAEYEFDSSSAVDSSGNGNNGTLVGSPTFGTGVTGGAIQLNGSNQYVTVANGSTLDPANAITLSAWINATDWNGNRRIIQKGNTDDQYRITAESGVLKFDLHGVGVITAALPSTGAWHLITGTYDGSTMKLYVDGVVVASAAHSGPIAVTSDPLDVGNKNGSIAGSDTFHGSLDDVRIYNRAINASEIAMLLAE